jgi:glycosyltransferase involved in cell wall biosynthesis
VRILHLIHNYYPSVGGSQELFKNVSERLVATFADNVTVFTTNVLEGPQVPSTGFIPAAKETINSVEVRRFPFFQQCRPALRAASRFADRMKLPFVDHLRLLKNGPISPSMFRAVLDFDADVVGGTSSLYLHMFYPLLARRLRKSIPFVYYGAMHIGQALNGPVLRAINAADAYVAYTAYERDYLVGKGVEPNKIHVVGLGVNAGNFISATGRQIRERYGIGDSFLVGFVGRQAAYKGIDTLLQAMRVVWRVAPQSYVFIAGPRTSFSDRLMQKIQSWSPRELDKIIFIDDFSEDEKPELFAACDVFVSVSSQESFGLVYLEAWASGKAVIGGRIGAVESVIKDQQDGLLVQCGDSNQLAESILVLLKNEKLRVKLGQHGRAKIFREHTWDIVTGKLRAIYEGLRPLRA